MRTYNSLKCYARGTSARATICGAATLLFAFLAFFLSAGFASAEPITVDLQPVGGDSNLLRDTTSYTLADINSAEGIIIGDKLFDYFSVVTTRSIGAIAPGLAEIAITAVQINGDYGLQFNGGWSAWAGQIADSTIEFRASILPAYVDLGYAFKDNSLFITAYGNDTATGLVSVSENLYTSNPMYGETSFADKLVYYQNDSYKKTTDWREFAPVTLMWIKKDVIANGGVVGGTGVAHLSEFYQTFSQVPEPGTLVLLGFGAIGLAAYAWRKRR